MGVYNTKSNRLGHNANSSIISSTLRDMSRWIHINASPFSLTYIKIKLKIQLGFNFYNKHFLNSLYITSFIVDLRYVFNLFNVENDLSGVAVDTGNVQNIFIKKCVFGKSIAEQLESVSNPLLVFTFPLPILVFHIFNSTKELSHSTGGK